MAKNKGKRGAPGGANSHIRARLEYLNKAASYLQSAQSQKAGENISHDANEPSTAPRTVPHIIMPSSTSERQEPVNQTPASNSPHLSRLMISQMRGVSLKTQQRLPIEVKRSFCKRCDTLLIPGVNSTQEIKNASLDRKKPWADVLVVRCSTCGTEKRFPQTERRSKKLSERRKEKENEQRQTECVNT